MIFIIPIKQAKVVWLSMVETLPYLIHDAYFLSYFTYLLQVPIYVISSVAEELLAYTNIIPEWLCKQRQEKLFSGESLFAHVELIKEKKIHVFPAVHSPKLLMDWQEPCVIFSPHWSLRLGPAVHLL
ncbi:hypothetical protein ACOSQ2_030732 [Xanthoceras sorbifolium]